MQPLQITGRKRETVPGEKENNSASLFLFLNSDFKIKIK